MVDPSETPDPSRQTDKNSTSVLHQTPDDLHHDLSAGPAHEALIASTGNLKAPRETGHHHRHGNGQPQEEEEEVKVEEEGEEEVRVVPIHQRPDLLLPCAQLVNEEWRRSQGARVHSLQKSCREFPVSLVLLAGPPGAERLLGHARLSRVVGHGASLFVESVVVPAAERGKGHGRTLMELTERYCRHRGFARLCLTTHDKQGFYGRLGYAPSAPVQSAGALASVVPLETLHKLLRPPPPAVSAGTPLPVAPPPDSDEEHRPPSIEHMELCALPHILLPLLLLLLVSPPPCASDQPTPHTPPSPPPSPLGGSAPVVTGRPFVVVWNMPTAHCQTLYGVRLNLGAFDIVVNSREHFDGQNMTIFYRDRLGAYPFVSRDGAEVNGGLPQSADLGAHLALAGGQIARRLRPDFAGLAVIDWEEWRPLWARNFDSKAVYRRRSLRRVRRERPDLTEGRAVAAEARREFEEGARRVMGETLRLGVTARPGGLWGYYGFPACYNDPKNNPQGANYTGQCHPGTSRLNDRLAWLWNESTALYPSIYLPRRLAGTPESALMVRHRVLEALRVGSIWRHDNTSKRATPVLPYARVAFTHTLDFLNVVDLQHTLGEAAAQGAAGVVLWGELEFARSKDQCLLLRDYLRGTLGHYVRRLRRQSHRCSHRRCHGNGRCARRLPGVGHMIRDAASGEGGSASFSKHFLCHCYQGWGGRRCAESRD